MVKVKTLKDVVIVAGHPRSGTSLACQLVESAGVKFPSDFKGDEYNKSGYYEMAAAMQLEKDLLKEAMSVKNTIKMNIIVKRLNDINGSAGLKIVRIPAIFFYRHIAENIRAVFIFRNPADVKASMLRRGISQFSLSWAENNNALIAAYENIPNSIIISYEALLRKDPKVVEKFKKIGLNVDMSIIKESERTQRGSQIVLSDLEKRVYEKLKELEAKE
jgi:hypothetical protein